MRETKSSPEPDGGEFVSWREFLGGAHAPALALVSLAVWLHAADSLIVATMLPAIVAEIGGAALVGWSVSLYEIGSILAGAASALLTMRHGLKRPMGLAAALFGAGCLLSALGTDMPMLLAGRLLQGLGGGGLVSMSFIAIGVLFPRRYIARAIAAISTLWGASAFLGPLVGAVFVEYANWRWGFGFFALQALGLAVWIGLRAEPGAGRPLAAAAGFPLRRLGVLFLAVVLVALGGVAVDAVRTPILIAAGLACLLAFLRLDARAAGDRLLPLRPFHLGHTTGAAFVMLLSLSVATIALTAFGPLLITAVHGASALTAGYIVACSSLGWSAAAILVSGSPERLDRLMIAIGMTVAALSVAGFLHAVPNGPVWLIAVFAGLEGAGFGIAWTFVLRRTTALARPDEAHRIAGAIPTVQRLGYALGAAWIGIVANASGFLTMQTPAAAADVAWWVFAASLPFAALGLVGMAALVRDRPAQQPPCAAPPIG